MNEWVVKSFAVREKIALDNQQLATQMDGILVGTKGITDSLLQDSDQYIELFQLQFPLILNLVILWAMYAHGIEQNNFQEPVAQEPI